MDNPYRNVDWSEFHQLHSFVHDHNQNPHPEDDNSQNAKENRQQRFDDAYERGIRHFAWSNYHPSTVFYPLEDYLLNIPSDAIGSPNTEHNGANRDGHFPSIGSFYESNPNLEGMDWRKAFNNMIDGMQFEDGGGIIIAHPNRHSPWNNWNLVYSYLDHAPEVLGIEVYNAADVHRYDMTHEEAMKPYYEIWDRILRTGRQCFGFATPDRGSWEKFDKMGRSILLVPEIDEHNALKAYRDGAFFSALEGDTLKFNDISLEGNVLKCEVNEDCYFKFYHSTISGSLSINQSTKITEKEKGKTAELSFNPIKTGYIRVEATNGSDMIFSQPIIINGKKEMAEMRDKTLKKYMLLD